MLLKKALILSLPVVLLIEAHALTLKEAVIETLENNPVVTERLKNYNATKQDVEIAEAGYYPTLNLRAGVGHQDISNSATGFEKKAQDVYETSLVLNQNLFNGFKTTYRVSTHEARLMGAAYSFIEKSNDMAFNITGQYLNVLKEKELLAIAVQNIEINEKIFNKVQALFNSGMTTLSEQQKIESSLALSRSNYFVSKNNFRDTKDSLKKVLGRNISAQELTKPVFEAELPKNRNVAMQFAIENNPSIRVADYDLKVAQEDYKEKRGNYLPSVDAEVRQGLNSNLNGIEGDENDFKAMLVLSYNLYRGGSDDAEVQKSRSVINKEVAIRNDLKRQVMEGFDFSWNAVEELQNQLIHLNKYKEHSVKTLVLYSDEYDMGRRSLLDLLAAQNDLISAKKQIVEAKNSLVFAKYRVLDAMGIMVPAIIGDIDEIYSQVGLGTVDTTSIDMLPVHLDTDKDSVSDIQDLCQNSTTIAITSQFGCEDKDIEIQRFNGLVFDVETQELDTQSLGRFNSIIADLNSSDMTDRIITIVSHTAASDNLKKDMLLTEEQGEWMKTYMSKHGVDVSLLNLVAKGSSEPLLIDDNSGPILNNSRTDIFISKSIIKPELETIEVKPKIVEAVTVTQATISETVESTPDSIDTDIHGHVVIVGSAESILDAEKVASKFSDITTAKCVIESGRNRFNIKLVSQNIEDAKRTLGEAKKVVSDAWYAGEQDIEVLKSL